MANRIIKLHGCSGAGKTTAARSLMLTADKIHEITPDEWDGKSNTGQKIEAYVCEFNEWSVPIAVLGSYKNNCGGMDSYPSDAPSIINLINTYLPDCHVLFEGLLLSTYYGKVGQHLEKLGDDFIMAFMNTPLLVCLERITTRRSANGTTRAFNPQLTVDKFNTIERLKGNAIKSGRRVVDIQYDVDPSVQLTKLFRNAI